MESCNDIKPTWFACPGITFVSFTDLFIFVRFDVYALQHLFQFKSPEMFYVKAPFELSYHLIMFSKVERLGTDVC